MAKFGKGKRVSTDDPDKIDKTHQWTPGPATLPSASEGRRHREEEARSSSSSWRCLSYLSDDCWMTLVRVCGEELREATPKKREGRIHTLKELSWLNRGSEFL